jgi:hypothetical protein
MCVDLDFRHAASPHHRLTIGRRRWLLVDTMNFFKTSLERACERLRLPVKKRPRPSYLGERMPTEGEWPAFEAYALDDARATCELAKFIIAHHEEFKIRPTVSVAAMAGRIFQAQFLRRTRIPFPDDGLLRASLLSYHGGKNGLYVPPATYDEVAEVDIVSAYPHAMTELPPLTLGHWEPVREYVPGAAGVYHVRGEVVDSCPYGVFLETGSTRKIQRGSFDSWVTGWELASAMNEVAIDTVEGHVWIPGAGSINPFAEYVALFFDKKQHTSPDDPRREMYKLLLNALYGKTIQRIQDDRHDHLVAGSLFNPFWASQITGHCRARLHALEHQYRALHTSTDSILTQAPEVLTGSGLGDLEIKARGRLILLRNKLYLIQDSQGRVVKSALHGFRGTALELLDLVGRGGGTYPIRHMVRPREALKTGEQPFRMISKKAQLHLPPEVFRMAAVTVAAHPLV